MDLLHKKVMALGKVLEFRRHHEVALDHEGHTVCHTRAVAVFGAPPKRETQLAVAEAVLGGPVAPGFRREYRYWTDTDDYGRPLVEVHCTDVEVPRAACGTTAG